MNASRRDRVASLITIVVIAMVVTHMFTVGYGIGFQSRGRAMMALLQAKAYTPSHLTISYERENYGVKDILRLEIDTTYRQIGKGGFCYEMVCDRVLKLQSSTGERFTSAEARNCFMLGGTRSWVAQHKSMKIKGYDCSSSIALDNGRMWQAWHTTQLPHCCENAAIYDGLHGLILVATSNDNKYRIEARTIELRLG